MNIDEVYTFVRSLANKDQSGYLKSAQFNQYAERAQMEVYMKRYGNPAEYQPGRPIPRVAYDMTQKIHDDLLPFITPFTMNVDKFGRGKYPVDYMHVSAFTYTVHKDDGDSKVVELEVIPDAKLGYRLSSPVVKPSKEYPICSMYGPYIQFYPSNLAVVKLSYLRKPVKPIWAFTIVDGRELYDSANSVQLEFPEDVQNEICVRILSYFGISIRETDVTQYAETKASQGI